MKQNNNHNKPIEFNNIKAQKVKLWLHHHISRNKISIIKGVFAHDLMASVHMCYVCISYDMTEYMADYMTEYMTEN